MLAEKGIVIARRTVAKYRSELNILPRTCARFTERHPPIGPGSADFSPQRGGAATEASGFLCRSWGL